jgi:polyisoprenoid-binding protein YceI
MLIYRVRHFGVSSFYGRVNLPAGRFRVDDGDLAGSFVEITAELRHMDAGDDNRDRFLASPDFFNVREYPTATFRSSRIGKTGDGTYEATGSFTMHGVTREVTAAIEGYATAQTGRFGFRAGFEAILNVKRSDFGMDLFVKEGTLGDEVRIVAAIEGVQR